MLRDTCWVPSHCVFGLRGWEASWLHGCLHEPGKMCCVNPFSWVECGRVPVYCRTPSLPYPAVLTWGLAQGSLLPIPAWGAPHLLGGHSTLGLHLLLPTLQRKQHREHYCSWQPPVWLLYHQANVITLTLSHSRLLNAQILYPQSQSHSSYFTKLNCHFVLTLNLIRIIKKY